jgi:hypothetical protein
MSTPHAALREQGTINLLFEGQVLKNSSFAHFMSAYKNNKMG